MKKLFCYELRRLLWNKMFFCILLVALGYGWLTLKGSVILGVAHTAPFSPWSFGWYLSQTLPLICLGELFFLSFFSSKEEQAARPLIQASPVDPRRYAATRCGAVLAGTALLALCVASLAVGFYMSLFGWRNYANLLLPALLTLLPSVVFCLGGGILAQRVHPALLYVLMAAVFLLCALPLPSTFSFSLNTFFSQHPLTLDGLDPPFRVPGAVIFSKVLCAWLGAALAAIGMRGKKTKK